MTECLIRFGDGRYSYTRWDGIDYDPLERTNVGDRYWTGDWIDEVGRTFAYILANYGDAMRRLAE